MKIFVRILLILVLLIGAVYAYIAWGPGVSVALDSIEAQPATERADAFRTIIDGVNRGDFGTNQFRAPDSGDPSDYEFLTFTLTVRNLYPLKAEWALINLTPAYSDIVLIQGEPADIPPFGAARISASVLALKTGAEDERMVWLEYYLFGDKKSAAASDATDGWIIRE